MQMKSIQNTIAGRNAKDLLSGAFNDIKDGTFSLDKLSGNSYDMVDDFDDILDDIKIDRDDPASVQLGESKKNTAILGKAIAEGTNEKNENEGKAQHLLKQFPYKIKKVIGQGAFGKVKLGINIYTEEEVAIKEAENNIKSKTL